MTRTAFTVGSLVHCRGREWVVVPSNDDRLVRLRPLTGSEEETCGIYLPLGMDTLEPATFPSPGVDEAGDFASCKLLWDAARLSLRNGAGPFRSMGRISVRPRPYQLVPLLLALRLNPVRLLIADDVGIGKTIEAALIARELFDRGEVRNFAVLCPPYLCDQWEGELRKWFNIEAVVLSSSTIGRLERMLPEGGVTVFEHFPFLVISTDYAKMPRRRDLFIEKCPALVIVDEAHACARPPAQRGGRVQHQRYELIRELADDPRRHIILLTATPHSGIEASFRSILGFLRREFDPELSPPRPASGKAGQSRPDLFTGTTGASEDALVPHFLIRKRKDIQEYLGETSPFPTRQAAEETYVLSEPYRAFFHEVYEFAREIVQTGDELAPHRRRVRYWAALSLLRCIGSSPASAEAALSGRLEREVDDLFESPGASGERKASDGSDNTGGHGSGARRDDADEAEDEVDRFRRDVLDPLLDTEAAEDTGATPWLRAAIEERGLRKLRRLEKTAAQLRGNDDNKIKKGSEVIARLLRDGHRPIIYCRFIKTAEYVGSELRDRLGRQFDRLRVLTVTSSVDDDQRRAQIEELARDKPRYRVLVATDCLSEGINLQEQFDAVLHYDLPWNPNRLEQREGRVDRFGQSHPLVHAVLLYGSDNPIDGAVLDVLIRKARDIRARLGVTVPVPMNSETVMEAVLHALLLRGRVDQQIELFPTESVSIGDIHKMWEEDAEELNRLHSRFAQKGIQPDEVMQVLNDTDEALGDKNVVKKFILSACHRLDATVSERNGVWEINLDRLPDVVKRRLFESYELGALMWDLSPRRRPRDSELTLRACFDHPAPEGVEVVGRHHPLTNALAEYVFESALEGVRNDGGVGPEPGARALLRPAARCGAVCTRAVQKPTVIVLLRVRYLLPPAGGADQFVEECVVRGYEGAQSSGREDFGSIHIQLPQDTVAGLLEEARPTRNLSTEERTRILAMIVAWAQEHSELFGQIAAERGKKLREAHRRVRKGLPEKRLDVHVDPVLPVDVLGVYFLLPG